MKKLIAISLITLSGCSTALSAHSGEYAQLSGTPEGLRAISDTLIGIAKTAKEKDNAPNQYFNSRANYEANVTERAKQKGFLQNLFNTSDKPEAQK